jgi:hypothetical protein
MDFPFLPKRGPGMGETGLGSTDGKTWRRRVYSLVGDGGGGAVWALEDVTSSPGAPRVDDAWLLTGTQY